MDFDFTRLSTRSFEQLVQSLAASVMGPGIVIFGDGPDGGREATFDCRIPFPSDIEPWHGYCVIQAKFRQRPAGSGKDDSWALGELKKEFEKFGNNARNLRKPDYYLFVTNVVLTPVSETGGKDRLTNFLESQKSKIGLKDFRIWDYDQLRVLLENHTDVRTVYTAWITPGDVLAKVLEQMQPRQNDFRIVMRNYVQKELCADQYVNLNQAGHNPKERVPLAQVFVDLPVGDQSDSAFSSIDPLRSDQFLEEGDSPATGAIAALLTLGAQRLDPLSNLPENRLQIREETRIKSPGRVVFIGGPGQGKSTLSQFLCQLHRVALLQQEEQTVLLPEVKDACSIIKAQCSHEDLSLPRMPRFPVRVELNRFAAMLADAKTDSLFDYLLQRIRQRTEREVSGDDLRSWLTAYPWLIVLDGLDEVPASSNRREVLESVQNFLVDAHGCNSDLLLVATTRPQGYNDDFSPRYYQHAKLLPLNVPQALHYAGRLVEQRWGGDADKVQKLMQRLERAGTEDATARLMQSPLQVTIMSLLVETVGQPPRERWRLFNDYYQVIFRREKERDIPAAELLNTYQADIDAIHQRVGLRLQADSERTKGTEALLSQEEFAILVKQRLEEEGHKGSEGERLQQEIMDAALERLVFIVPPQSGKVGFEIRSLQEFMAAQCLMNGSDEDIKMRLRAIAPAAHWRNVFLFAAGRCFYDKQHLRDNLHTLCCELNEGEGVPGCGELERATLAGSRLALDILEDGALTRQPAQLKLYTRLALRLLELPPCPEQVRLAKSYLPELEDLYKIEIQKYLTSGTCEQRFGAWQALFQLIEQSNKWAKNLAETCWPDDAGTATMIFLMVDNEGYSEWLSERLLTATLKSKPHQKISGFWDRQKSKKENLIIGLPGWFKSMWEALDWRTTPRTEVFIQGISKNFGFTFISIFFGTGWKTPSLSIDQLPIADDLPENTALEWGLLLSTLFFYQDCTKEKLAEILYQLSSWMSDDRASLIQFSFSFPWPIGACIRSATDGKDLMTLSSAALSGALGDYEDWKRAEERWNNAGLTVEDFRYVPESGLPFDRQIATIGYPFCSSGAVISHGESFLSIVLKLYDLLLSSPSAVAHRQIVDRLLSILSAMGYKGEIWETLSPIDFCRLFHDKTTDRFAVETLGIFPDSFWKDSEGVEALKLLGDFEQLHCRAEVGNLIILKLESLAAIYPKEGSLLRLLATVCVATGYRPTLSNVCLKPRAFANIRYQAAALLIRIAQANWLEDEANQFVEIIASLGELTSITIDDALIIIEKQNMVGRQVELFLFNLYSQLPNVSWRTRRNLIQAMQEQQRSRLGNSEKLFSSTYITERVFE